MNVVGDPGVSKVDKLVTVGSSAGIWYSYGIDIGASWPGRMKVEFLWGTKTKKRSTFGAVPRKGTAKGTLFVVSEKSKSSLWNQSAITD
jgi:hypothetical protein